MNSSDPNYPKLARLPKTLPTIEPAELGDQCDLAQGSISSADYTGQTTTNILLDQIRLRRVNLTRAHWVSPRLFDCVFETCDISAAKWEKAHLRRIEFVSSRMLGLDLTAAAIEDGLFKECNAESSLWFDVRFRCARFIKCNLRHAVFEGVDLSGIVFSECDLSSANLQGAKMVGTDLRSSILDGLQIGPQDLRGAIISPEQAAQVVTLIGVTVKEIDPPAAWPNP
jgi:uncharacterized protein YjbI with pentapeptide repeats